MSTSYFSYQIIRPMAELPPPGSVPAGVRAYAPDADIAFERVVDPFGTPMWKALSGGGSDPAIQVFSAMTVDATPVMAWQLPMPVNSAVMLRATMAARRTDATPARLGQSMRGLFYREGGGATQEGSTLVQARIASDATWESDFSVSGANAQLFVRGAAGGPVNWYGRLEIVRVT